MSRAVKRGSNTIVAWSLATWFGCGLSPIAPGTVGTFGALPLYFLVRSAGPIAILSVAAVLMAIGIWASNVVVAESGEVDDQRIVIDEVVGVLVPLASAPLTWSGVAVAIGLFRLFDITKPWPARPAERLPGGWGIVSDDVVAGVWATAGVLFLRALAVLS